VIQTKQRFGIAVGTVLILTGKVKINIRRFIAIKAKEGFKGNLVSVSSKRFGNLVFARMTLVDANGNLVPDDDRTLEIKTAGGLAFKAACNGDPTSLEPFNIPRMKTFRGELVAIGEGPSGSLESSITK